MTLSRQLALILSLLFLLVFAGTLVISVNNTRDYLQAQLRSHAQDTATSLGLSLVPPLRDKDMVEVETMVNAIFDPGYYREIELTATDGSVLVTRELPVVIDGVPDWFVRLVPLDTPREQSEISVDWRIVGTINISSHPGYAYRDLWRTSLDTFWWFLATLAGAVLLLVVILRFILAPLRSVEAQALAISEREFPVLEKLPFTRELRRVVVAMNRMSTKVRQMLTDQTALSERMREQAHQDPVTGLANRRRFDAVLKTMVEGDDQFMAGALYLYELNGFKAYNERHGYTAGDQLLREVTRVLRGAVDNDDARHLLARLGGATFALLARDLDRDEAEALAGRLVRELSSLHAEGLVDEADVGKLGMAYYDGARGAGELLSEADMALRAAQSQGPNAWSGYREIDRGVVRGAGEWQDLIRATIDRRDLLLHYQPALTCSGRDVMHHEVLGRIASGSGDPVPAAVFFPMAERHGLSPQLDRLVVAAALDRLAAHGGELSLAVNLSAGAVADPAFRAWLAGELKARPGEAARLLLEAPEYAVVRQLEAARELIGALRGSGVRMGLDHFGAGFGSFGYLKSLKIDYIKLDGSYFRGVEREPDNRFFVQSVADIAHGLDLTVIAEAIETEAEWRELAGLHLDGAQGYYLGRPGPNPLDK